MKLALFAIVALFFSVATMVKISATDEESASPGRMLRHVVLLGFKETSSAAEIQEVVDGFKALPGKIDAIADFEFGANNSPEGLNDGLTHCFLVSFASEADREAYLPHPAHKAFVEILKPHMTKAVVVDYWNKQ